MSLSFIVTSDLHFTPDGPREDKKNDMELIKTICQSKQQIDAVLVVGDLTHSGQDGASCCGYAYGGKEDQLGAFKKEFVEELEKVTDLHLCLGDRDHRGPWWRRSVVNYVAKREGGQRYYFDLKGVRFICLGLFPDIISRMLLKSWLSCEIPNVIYFHFNPMGAFSSWWSESDKQAFYNIINAKCEFGNKYEILCLVCGHWQETYDSYWNGIRVLSGAGKGFLKATFSGTTLQVTRVV